MSDHWNDARPGRRSQSEQLRSSLRDVGIELDDPDRQPSPQASTPRPHETDRAAIRAVLEPLGAPEWAIASCPSLELAATYRPSSQPRVKSGEESPR